MQSFDSYVEGVSKLKAGGSRTVPNRFLKNNILVKIFLFQMAGLLVLKNAIKLA